MSYTITMKGQDFNDLTTAANFAAKDKARPILMAVALKTCGEIITATATDSYKLVKMQRDIVELAGDYANADQVLMPAETLLKAAKTFKTVRKNYSDVIVTIHEDDTFTISSNGDILGGQLVAGRYPDVDSLFPTEDGLKPVVNDLAFNASFLADFAKVAPFNGKSGDSSSALVVTTIQDDKRPIKVVSVDRRTVGLLMPVRVR